MKRIGMLLMVLIGVLMLSGIASAATVPVTIDEVKVDGSVVSASATTRLDLERGQEIPLRVEITAASDAQDVQIEAFISGYEYSDRESVSDTSHIFDVEANVTYVKKLTLSLPDKAEEDDYKLRIIITDRNSDEIIANYKIKVDVPRHNIAIKDVVFSPEGTVQAGRSLLATVRVKNMGEQDEEGIKIKVSIPDLGISAADYIDELEGDESTTSEELYLRIPSCAEAGDYSARVEIEYDEGYEKIIKQMSVEVTEGELCPASPTGNEPSTPSARTIISLSTTSQNMEQGQAGVVYPMTITNNNANSRSYTLTVQGVEGWAQAEVSPSNTMVLGAGETGTLYVYLTSADNAAVGEHVFIAKVASGDETLKEIGLKANVAESTTGAWSKVKRALEIALVILVVLLVILGLIVGFSKLKGEQEDSEEPGQTYY